MKRSILLLLCALMAILCLAGCDLIDNILGNDDPEEHTHTYAPTLSSDATGHWYAATCECEDAGKKDFAAHVDLTGGLNGGKDGKCDTCAYAVCAHTYATEWSKDATHHWHAVTCGCEVAAEKTAHTYTEDGCVCGYMQTLDLTEAVYNGTIAFNAADAVGEAGWWEYVAPVTFTVATPGTYSLVNDDYVSFFTDELCENYIDSVTTTEAGESVTVYAYTTTYGTTAEDKTVAFDVVSAAIEITAERGAAELLRGTVYTLVWTAPAAGTYYIDDLELPVVWDDWVMNDFFVLEATEAGQEFSFTVYYYGEDFGEEGTENFTLNWFIQPFTAEALTLGQAKELSVVLGAPTALTFTATVAGTYKITSNNPATCYGFWNVSEYGAMMFWSDAGDQEVVLMAGETFTFYVMVEEAATDVDVTVTGTLEAELEQLVVGTDKTVTFANGDEAFDGAYYVIIATEAGWYKVVADGLVAVDSNYDDFSNYVYLEAGEIVAVNVYYGDDDAYDPSSSYTVSLVYSAEEPTPEVTYDTELYINWYSSVLVEAEGTTPVTLTVTSAGTYVISVETLNGQLADRTGMNIAIVGQSLTVVVTEQDLTDFDGEMVIPYFVSTTDGLGGVIEIYVEKQAEEEEEDYGEYVKDIDVTVTDTYLMEYIDSYSFTATVAGDYAFFVPAGLGFWIDGEAAPRVDYQDVTGGGNLGGVVVVTIQAGETLGFSVGAATTGDFTIELYADEPTVDDGGDDEVYVPADPFNATYTGSFSMSTIVVVFDKAAGTVTVTPNVGNPYTCDFVYEGGELTLTKDGNAVLAMMLSFTLTEGVPTACTYNGNDFPLTALAPEGGEDEEPAGLAGNYTASDDWSNSFTVVITADTITFTPPMSNEVVVTYTYENGIVTLYADGSAITNPGAMSLTITDGVVTGMMYNMTSYTLTASTGGGNEEPTGDVLVLGTNNVTLTDNEAVNGKSYTFVADAAGTYTFASSDLLAIIFDSTGMQIGRGQVSLEAGTYTVTLVNISEVGGNFTVNVSFEAASVGDEGTEDNPIVLDDLSATISHNGAHDVYYTYTVTEDCSITVNTEYGNVVYILDGETLYSASSVYAKAGSVVVFNIYVGDWQAEDIEYTYTFTVGEYAEEGDFGRPNLMYQDGEFSFTYPGGNDPEKFVWFKANIYDNGYFVINFTDIVSAKVGTDPENMVAITDATTKLLVSGGDVLYLAIQSFSLAEAEIAFTTEWEYPEGTTSDNPFEAVDGENTKEIPTGAYELYFEYTPAVNGTITVTFENVTLKYYSDEIYWWDAMTNGATFDVIAGVPFQILAVEWVEGATEVSFDLAFAEAAEVEIEGELVETLDFLVPTISEMFANSEEQSINAPAGVYTIDFELQDELDNTNIQVYDAASDTWTKINNVAPYVITLAEDGTLEFRVQAWADSDAGKTVTVKVYYAEA